MILVNPSEVRDIVTRLLSYILQTTTGDFRVQVRRPPAQEILLNKDKPRCIIKYMVLSGEAIKTGIQKGIIKITPFSQDQVETAHINLHLGESQQAQSDGILRVPAKGFVIARTKEKVTIPSNICGLIEGRAKLAQQGISVEQSSKFIEPDSDSTMVLEVFNASDVTVSLVEGQKIAKMVLLKVVDEI